MQLNQSMRKTSVWLYRRILPESFLMRVKLGNPRWIGSKTDMSRELRTWELVRRKLSEICAVSTKSSLLSRMLPLRRSLPRPRQKARQGSRKRRLRTRPRSRRGKIPSSVRRLGIVLQKTITGLLRDSLSLRRMTLSTSQATSLNLWQICLRYSISRQNARFRLRRREDMLLNLPKQCVSWRTRYLSIHLRMAQTHSSKMTHLMLWLMSVSTSLMTGLWESLRITSFRR